MTKRKDTSVENWITVAEAAEILGITPNYVGKLIRTGRFEARKVTNRLLLVNKESLEGWTRKQKRHDSEQ